MSTWAELYSFGLIPIQLCEVTYTEVIAPRRDKSCGRMAEKCGLRTWL